MRAFFFSHQRAVDANHFYIQRSTNSALQTRNLADSAAAALRIPHCEKGRESKFYDLPMKSGPSRFTYGADLSDLFM